MGSLIELGLGLKLPLHCLDSVALLVLFPYGEHKCLMVPQYPPALLNSLGASETAFLETLSEMGSLLDVQVFCLKVMLPSSYLQPYYTQVGLSNFMIRRRRVALVLKKVHRLMKDGMHRVI
jgi:hypothetical protein